MAVEAVTVASHLDGLPPEMSKLAPPEMSRESATSVGYTMKMVLNLDGLCADLDTDFGVSAFQHLSEAVRDLTADHNRRMRVLRKENQEMERKLTAALQGTQVSAPATNREEPQAATATASNAPTSSPGGSSGTHREAKPAFTQLGEHDGVNEVQETGLKSSPVIEDQAEQIEGNDVPKRKRDRFMVRMQRFVRSPKFDSVIGAVIIANTLIMSLQLEYKGRVFKDEVLDKCVECSVRNLPIETFFEMSEHVFTGVFTSELVVRLVFIGCRYLFSVSNALDAIVVIVSMADSWVLGPMGSNVFGSVAVLRLIRLMRLAKILRVVRVMKAFKSLRVLVAAVVNSVGALGWSMTLLFVLELVGAIFMAQVIQPFMEDAAEDELQTFIWNSFGTWTNSMLTIFEITMAPGGFIKYRRLYEEVHPLFAIFFVIYVCVVTFAVVRVITAMFLKATLSASDSEELNAAQEQSEQWSKYIKTVKASMGEEATDINILTYEELEALLKIETVAKWLQGVGISTAEVARMFMALHQSPGGGVSQGVVFSEFEHALRQMSSMPRGATSILNLFETRDVLRKVNRLESQLAGAL